jgi:hypothetical protein
MEEKKVEPTGVEKYIQVTNQWKTQPLLKTWNMLNWKRYHH